MTLLLHLLTAVFVLIAVVSTGLLMFTREEGYVNELSASVFIATQWLAAAVLHYLSK